MSQKCSPMRRRALVVPARSLLPPSELADAPVARSRSAEVETDDRTCRRPHPPRREPLPSAHAPRSRLIAGGPKLTRSAYAFRRTDTPFLRPDEVIKLLSHPDVPLERKHVYTVAIYTAMRKGELRALRVRDIDWDAMQISVLRQVKNGKEKSRASLKRRPPCCWSRPPRCLFGLRCARFHVRGGRMRPKPVTLALKGIRR